MLAPAIFSNSRTRIKKIKSKILGNFYAMRKELKFKRIKNPCSWINQTLQEQYGLSDHHIVFS